MSNANNLFTVLTLIAAPAILTNASSVLALNTANRFGRVVDRSRVVAAGMRGFTPESFDYELWRRQLERLKARAELLIRAQTGLYFAIGAFVATALIAVCGAVLSEPVALAAMLFGGAALALGVLATGSLLGACLRIVQETRIALAGLRDDVTAFGDPRPSSSSLAARPAEPYGASQQ